MKKVLLFILLNIFFLSSCGSGEEEKKDGLTTYKSSEVFSMRIPEGWDIIENKKGILPKPKSGDIELAVTSKSEKDGFSNNLLILSENPQIEVTASDYISSVSLNPEKEYYEYKKIEEKDFTFIDGNKSKIFIFEARYDDKTPKLKFLQTADICEDKKAYFITLALPTGFDDLLKYEYMLSTFNCKK